ncbi:MAG: 2-C-methyl-D-erythritol 2,4-cyclodiphosphate synthase [Dehalococcoidales bacterium]|jgi:2-C-methyl-D-erythritol 2,4-cyclodiphosphate synthase
MSSNIRVGSGFDVHPLEPGHRFVLGGVTIPFEMGLVGWSDADVLAHAIIDALLGAAALGNIGEHFPTGNPAYRDISSLILLKKTGEELAQNGWGIVNIDATILAEQPRLAPYLPQMSQQLSRSLGIEPGQINVKAKTSDGLGIIGRGEGIAALTTVLVELK